MTASDARGVEDSAARIATLEDRLEMRHAWVNGERIAVPPGSVPDGIDCRNETIRQQDRRIAELEREVERLTEARDDLDQAALNACRLAVEADTAAYARGFAAAREAAAELIARKLGLPGYMVQDIRALVPGAEGGEG